MVFVMTEEKEKAYYLDKIREKTEGFTWMPLPSPEWALAPDWAGFYDDISCPEQFNERFIESRVAIGGMASALKLFSFIGETELLFKKIPFSLLLNLASRLSLVKVLASSKLNSRGKLEGKVHSNDSA